MADNGRVWIPLPLHWIQAQGSYNQDQGLLGPTPCYRWLSELLPTEPFSGLLPCNSLGSPFSQDWDPQGPPPESSSKPKSPAAFLGLSLSCLLNSPCCSCIEQLRGPSPWKSASCLLSGLNTGASGCFVSPLALARLLYSGEDPGSSLPHGLPLGPSWYPHSL